MLSWQKFVSEEHGFIPFSLQHYVVIGFFTLCLIGIIWSSLRLPTHKNQLLARGLSLLLSLSIVVWATIKLSLGTFNPSIDLPLNLCNVIALLAPLIFWNPSLKRYEMTYFLVMAGTFQAFITPDLYQEFPSYTFFKYWIVHGGVILIVIHSLLAFRLYPRLKGILTTFVCINLYAAVMYPINLWLKSNYMYLVHKPLNPSILDYLGPWPFYILAIEAVALIIFFLLYLPILALKKHFPVDPKTLAN